jgi:hypothetical protein
MLDINNIFLFVFTFSILGVFRVAFKLFVSLFGNPPKKLELSNRETILLGLFISYIITYIFN